jgi:hypothetical protein
LTKRGDSNGLAPKAGELDVRAPWREAADAVAPGDPGEWYRGAAFNVLPDKRGLEAQGMQSLLTGWAPDRPVIDDRTRVIGVGSCFASYFLLWLAENGFNRSLEHSPHNALIRYGSSFENAAVIAQQFRWAFEGLDASHVTWIDKEKQLFEANEERRLLVRRTLEQTDVLVLTLGLSELWYDKQSGEPLWRALTRRHYDPERHVFRVETMADTKRSLETIEAIRKRHLPGLKIVFTVSPVRLRATFRPVSAISANSVSKAILRGALDEFLRESGGLNRDLFYFPSYEIVHDFFRDAFEADNRHVRPYVAARVVRCFADHYCDMRAVRTKTPGSRAAVVSDDQARFLDFANGDQEAPPADESARRIAELEDRLAELQRICDDRLAVIGTLESAARERLELIQRLDAECAALRQGAAGK